VGPALLAHVVGAGDVGVADAPREPDLAAKPLELVAARRDVASRIFSATTSPTSTSSARYTVPIPPRPTIALDLVAPREQPGRRLLRARRRRPTDADARRALRIELHTHGARA
jgi:hypothetical protein